MGLVPVWDRIEITLGKSPIGSTLNSRPQYVLVILTSPEVLQQNIRTKVSLQVGRSFLVVTDSAVNSALCQLWSWLVNDCGWPHSATTPVTTLRYVVSWKSSLRMLPVCKLCNAACAFGNCFSTYNELQFDHQIDCIGVSCIIGRETLKWVWLFPALSLWLAVYECLWWWRSFIEGLLPPDCTPCSNVFPVTLQCFSLFFASLKQTNNLVSSQKA